MELLLDGANWTANFFEPQPELIKYRRGKVNPELFGRLEASCSIQKPWRKEYRPQGWMVATVPGDAGTVAANHGLIPDPMLARNADGALWINNKEWCFRREFAVPKSWAGFEIELEALGLDYEAEIYLNGELLGTHADMFVPFRARVEQQLLIGESNVLLVRFFALPHATPHHYNKKVPERSHHLRSQVSVGWDTGRSVQSAGIWDSIRLVAWKRERVRDLWVRMIKGSEGKSVTAEVEFQLECGDSRVRTVSWMAREKGRSQVISSGQKMKLRQTERGTWTFSIEIPEAKFWWPIGLGEASLYVLELQVEGQEWTASDQVVFGLRQIEWQRPQARPDAAHALQCVVNKVPVFIHGMCWVPPDLRFSQISREQYERQLELARRASFNLIRVWGGGLIEKRDFYDLCDEKGLLVWQEFPLACANYPEDNRSVVRRGIEGESVIRRLRSHACLALWCGGNEMLSYGMKKEHTLLQNYGGLVELWHPGSSYRPVSPMDGSEEGHGPWGMFSHTFWNSHNYTLASEVGCPALAVPRSLARMIPAGEMDPRPSRSDGFHAEDFGPSFGYRYAFLVEDDPPPPDDWKWVEYPGMTWHGYRSILGHTRHLQPKDLTELSFLSQWIQSDSLGYVFDEYRRRWPENSGIALWQYNESWPALVYSIVDYYGVPKQAYYTLKEACQPVLLSIRDSSNRIKSGAFEAEIWGANVTAQARVIEEGSVQIRAWSGEFLYEQILGGTIPESSANKLADIRLSLPEGQSLILIANARLDDGRTLRRHALYWDKADPRAWAVQGEKPEVMVRRMRKGWEFSIRNAGSSFLGGIYLEVEDRQDYWSDNFLLLAPGEIRCVHLDSAAKKSSRWHLQSWAGYQLQGVLP